jgi:hypothetical protein
MVILNTTVTHKIGPVICNFYTSDQLRERSLVGRDDIKCLQMSKVYLFLLLFSLFGLLLEKWKNLSAC